jgi:hypothetical protein
MSGEYPWTRRWSVPIPSHWLTDRRLLTVGRYEGAGLREDVEDRIDIAAGVIW